MLVPWHRLAERSRYVFKIDCESTQAVERGASGVKEGRKNN